MFHYLLAPGGHFNLHIMQSSSAGFTQNPIIYSDQCYDYNPYFNQYPINDDPYQFTNGKFYQQNFPQSSSVDMNAGLLLLPPHARILPWLQVLNINNVVQLQLRTVLNQVHLRKI